MDEDLKEAHGVDFAFDLVWDSVEESQQWKLYIKNNKYMGL